MALRIIALLLALSCCAQDKLVFEVASVKPSPPPADGRVRVSSRGGPGTSDPTRFTATNLALFNLVMLAYNIKPYQISGPDWLRTQRFDVAANVPSGASKEQFQAMMQSLLAERFKLAVHRENKEMPIYELVIGKGGPKMKESEDQSDAEAGPAPPRPSGPPKLDRYGFPEIPAGQNSEMMMPGRARMTAYRRTMDALAGGLSGPAGRPVIDSTGLKKKYDFTLTFDPSSMDVPPPGAVPASERFVPDGEAPPPLSAALQEQLGLKLESKRAPVEIIVVDKVEKTPTEN